MNRRDIELLISARDTTGRTFKQVTDNIAALNRTIDEQTAAAERGEGSLKDLKAAQEQLAQAGRDLSALQGQIDAYEKLLATEGKVTAANEAAKAKLAALSAEIEKAGKATAAQESKLQRYETAVEKTSAAVDKNKADIASQIVVLERAGVATNALDAAQAEIVNSARQVGAGLVQTNAAIDSYATNLTAAKDREATARRNAVEVAKLEEAEQKAILSRETAAIAAAAAQRKALYEQIETAERQLAAQNVFDQKIAQARELGNSAAFIRLFAEATQTVAVAENQLSALNGFRAVGAQAAEASRDISQFVTAGQTMAVSTQQVANGLRAILSPGAEALRTLDGLEAAIAQTGTVANAEKGSVAGYSNALNELATQAAALAQQGGLVDTFKSQAAATDLARQKFTAAQAEVQRLGTAMAQADAPTEALATDLKRAETTLQELGAALVQEETKLGQTSRALKAAKIDTDNLETAQERLAAAARQVAAASDNANKVLGRGGQKATGLFGLNPYEIQNLGYQINDIVVSLASGQKPLTVLTQQGLQISQLFPGLISNVGAFVVANGAMIAGLGLLAAGFVAVGAVISNYNEDLQRVRDFQQALSTIGNNNGNSAQSLADLSEKLQLLGVSAEDAKATLLAFVNEGLNPAQVAEYSQAALDLSQRLGTDLATATNSLISIQQGGMETVLELTSKTHDLTQAELDHAQALFDAGKAAEARQYILDRVAEKNRAIAEATQSQWTPAVNNLKTAFSNFMNYLSSLAAPVLDGIQNRINNVVLGLTYVTGLLAGKGQAGALADAQAVFNRQQNKPPPGTPGASGQQIRDRQYQAQLDKEYQDSKLLTAEERRRNAVVEARRKAQAAGVSKTVEDLAATRALAKVNAEITKEQATAGKAADAAAKRAQSARDKAARAAESLANKQEAAQRQLDGQLRQLDSAEGRGPSATLEARLRIVDNQYQSIFETIQKLRGLGISKSADGTDLATVEAQVNASKERLKQETTIKFYQEQAALLEKQRAAEIARVQDAQERGAISVKDAVAQTAEINARLSPQITGAAQKALEIAKAIAGATPSPEMVSLIASLERIVTGEGTNNIVAKVGLEGLENQSKKLDDILKQRDELVQGYQTLMDLGIKTAGQTRESIRTAFASSATDIEPMLVKLRETVELLHQQKDPLTGLPILTETAYQTWLAKIAAVNAGLTQQKGTLSTIETDTLMGIANAGVNAFSTLGSSLAGLIAGTKSWGDVFADVGGAILQSLADITASIAQAIIKFLILRALESAAGLPPGTLSGGGGSMGGFFGLFHSGGVVGQRNGTRRRDNPAMWIGAPKFHSGGGAGLGADEYRAILKRNEEVLTEDDPRHVRNGGGMSAPGGGDGGMGGLKQVLLLDPEAVPNAMQTRSGQKSLLTVIRQNKETIKQVLK